jgi:hypothetical protein
MPERRNSLHDARGMLLCVLKEIIGNASKVGFRFFRPSELH